MTFGFGFCSLRGTVWFRICGAYTFFLLSSSVLGKTWVLVRFALAAWVWVLSHLYLKLIMLISLYNHV